MNIPPVIVKDTHGALTYDILKHDIEDTALEAVDIDGSLHVTYRNINYKSIPGVIPGSLTYKFYLTYNGTNGRNSLYSTVLMDEEGILDLKDQPEFVYSPKEFAKDVINVPERLKNIDITFFTSEANILQFKPVESICDGTTTYTVMSHKYPHHIGSPTNVSSKQVNYDGWYTATFAVFKDLKAGDCIIKDEVYSYKGVVGKAAASGDVVENGGELYIGDDLEALVELTYDEFILHANNLTGIATESAGHIANSQILVTKDINAAIINSIKKVNEDTCDNCSNLCEIGEWQKLQQKKLAAFILFREGDFKKAQIVLESARVSCSTNNAC